MIHASRNFAFNLYVGLVRHKRILLVSDSWRVENACSVMHYLLASNNYILQVNPVVHLVLTIDHCQVVNARDSPE